MENQQKEIDVVQLAKVVWSHKRKLLRWGIAGFVIGVVVAVSIPKEYRSSVKMATESNSKNISSSMGALAGFVGMNPLGNEGGINEKLYPEILKTSPFLLEFANVQVEYDEENMPLWIYLSEKQKKAWWKYVIYFPFTAISWFSTSDSDTLNINNSVKIQSYFTNELGSKIVTSNDKNTGMFTVAVSTQDKKISYQLAQMLPGMLQKYMTHYKTEKTRANLESNIKMLEQAKQNYYDADNLYAETADRNQNLIAKSAQVKLERLRAERDLAFQVYQQLAMQVETDKIKLQEETVIATVIEPATTPFVHSSPRRMVIVLGFTIFAMLVLSSVIIIKELNKE